MDYSRLTAFRSRICRVVPGLFRRHEALRAQPALGIEVAQADKRSLAVVGARGALATGQDPRVTMGYALVYPVAMVVKIIVCQVLTIL